MLAIIVAEGPPTRSGARKSPSERTNAKVAPASSPGIESGRTTRRNVVRRSAPRSCEASTLLRQAARESKAEERRGETWCAGRRRDLARLPRAAGEYARAPHRWEEKRTA